MNKESKIKKIKSLLALGSSSNENESANAIAKAKAMLRKYNINQSDLTESEINEFALNMGRGKKFPDYILRLAHNISKLFDCEILLISKKNSSTNFKYQKTISFIGFDGKEEIAAYVFDNMNRKLNNARASYLKSIRGTKNSSSRADSYALGWVITVNKRIEKAYETERTKQAQTESPGESKSTDLIVSNALKNYIDNKATGKTKGKRTKTTTDIHNGFRDGEGVAINKGVNSNSNRKRQLFLN